MHKLYAYLFILRQRRPKAEIRIYIFNYLLLLPYYDVTARCDSLFWMESCMPTNLRCKNVSSNLMSTFAIIFGHKRSLESENSHSRLSSILYYGRAETKTATEYQYTLIVIVFFHGQNKKQESMCFFLSSFIKRRLSLALLFHGLFFDIVPGQLLPAKKVPLRQDRITGTTNRNSDWWTATHSATRPKKMLDRRRTPPGGYAALPDSAALTDSQIRWQPTPIT